MYDLPIKVRWTEKGKEKFGTKISLQGTNYYDLEDKSTEEEWEITPKIQLGIGEMFFHRPALIAKDSDENHFYLPMDRFYSWVMQGFLEIVQ